MSNLHEASRQWAERPADERFWTLAEMHAQTREYKAQSRVAEARAEDLRFDATADGEVVVRGRQDVPARLGHFAFGQASRLVGAPAGYLRSLSAQLAADCLNHGQAAREENDRGDLEMLFRINGGTRVRAITSQRYCRIWDADIVEHLLPLQADGWRVPPARSAQSGGRTRIATEEDCLRSRQMGAGLQVQVGDEIGPSGLYASDKDMFAFLVNEDRPVDDGAGNALYRGFFVSNSEVGDRAFELTTFLYNAVCGNHIVWGAEDVSRVRIVHLGKTADARAYLGLRRAVKSYADKGALETASIKAARNRLLGNSRDEVVDALFKRKVATRTDLDASYAAAEEHTEDHNANPASVWGMVSGMTRVSQESRFADKRVALDKAAGKVLKMAF